LPPFFEEGAGQPTEEEFSGSALDTQWVNADVGTAGGSHGDAAVSNGVLNVSAGGSGVSAGSVAVGYHGLFRNVSGDFAATVQVLAVPDNQENAFGGLVVTGSTDPFAAFALPFITPRQSIQQWVRPISGAHPIATVVSNGRGSTLLPAWLKIRRVGDTVAYWWTQDPAQGTPEFGGIEQLDDFAAKELLVGVAASAGVSGTSGATGFRFAHFRLVPLGN